MIADPGGLRASSVNSDEIRAIWPQIPAQGDITETVGDVSPGLSDANGLHYFVTTQRELRRHDETAQHMENYYIVTSRDGGRTWGIVDLSCVDERWPRARSVRQAQRAVHHRQRIRQGV